MLIWLILLATGIHANQVDMRQMKLQVLSNSYFNASGIPSIILQKTVPRSNSIFVGCPQLCLSMGSSCSKAVYNSTNQICTIYNTAIGIQQTSSCCTTFGNSDINKSVVLPPNPQITNASNLCTGRRSHTATLLSSGEVLVIGGRTASTIFSSCELFSSGNLNWTVVASMNSPRALHTATLLTTNNIDLVFVVGGFYTTSHTPLSSVEYYNTSSNQWTLIGNSMADARYAHSTTVLKNGRFLVAGGSGTASTLASSEIFDPSTLTWQTVGSLNVARMQHMDTILDNGNVFVAGGVNPNYLQSCELFDAILQTWSLVPDMSNARNLGSLVSLLSISSSLLITGGSEQSSVATSSADLYYPSSNTIIPSTDMTYQRFEHSSNLIYYQSTPLVVVAGGYNSLSVGINSVQLYIVANATWRNIIGLQTDRGGHTATVLNISPLTILIVAGQTSFSATTALNTVEILTF